MAFRLFKRANARGTGGSSRGIVIEMETAASAAINKNLLGLVDGISLYSNSSINKQNIEIDFRLIAHATPGVSQTHRIEAKVQWKQLVNIFNKTIF